MNEKPTCLCPRETEPGETEIPHSCGAGTPEKATRNPTEAQVASKAAAMRRRAAQIPPPPVEGASWVPLNKGLFALVDTDVVPSVNSWCWTAGERGGTHYAQRQQLFEGVKKTIYLHRSIMQTPDGFEVDHINGHGWDCRRSNMRNCNRTENVFNTKKRRAKTTSLFKGVTFKTREQRWIAKIKHGNRHVHIGTFASEKEAAVAYNEFAKKVAGEFAKLNIIP